MKNTILLFPIVFALLSYIPNCENVMPPQSNSSEQEHQYTIKTDSSHATKIKFDYYEFDAGEVLEGPSIKYEFPFTNIGKIPLVIRSCKSSCGCVIPICEKRFILPGEKGVFKAEHMTKGHTGYTRKTITMRANTDPEMTVLRLGANIISFKEE